MTKDVLTIGELFDGYDDAAVPATASELIISGMEYDSRKVSQGELLFCIPGTNMDGATFASSAIENGAVALVAARQIGDIASDVPVIIAKDPRSAMAYASARFQGSPSRDFKLVGITGTNGKTTTTYLVEHIVRDLGKKSGVIGTTGIRIGDTLREQECTTPESVELQQIFADMRDENCDVVAMEVSAHALSQHRVFMSDFDVVAFTNLTQDHLDYYETMDRYYAAKRLLFDKREYPGAACVINIDDEYGKKLYVECRDEVEAESKREVISFSFSDTTADIHPVNVELSSDGISGTLSVFGKDHDVSAPLVGRFNVENVMCAIGICVALGFDAGAAVHSLASFPGVPGRMQRVIVDDRDNGDGVGMQLRAFPSVYVDYAHTPDALENVLRTAHDVCRGNLICVFGCGGDRDKGKRPQMGQIAQELADVVYITSDNPRTEDPDFIIADICDGISDVEKNKELHVIPGRADAIFSAIGTASPDDMVIIAGKGHEDYQIIGMTKHHFDDREQAAKALMQYHHTACRRSLNEEERPMLVRRPSYLANTDG